MFFFFFASAKHYFKLNCLAVLNNDSNPDTMLLRIWKCYGSSFWFSHPSVGYMHPDLLLKNISDVHSHGTGSVSEMKSQHLTCHKFTLISLFPPSLHFFSYIKVPKTYVFLKGIWAAKLKREVSIWRINHLNEADDRVAIFTLECTKWLISAWTSLAQSPWLTDH